MYKERERERKNKQNGWLETPKVANTFVRIKSEQKNSRMR